MLLLIRAELHPIKEKDMKHFIVVSLLVAGLFSVSALAGERSAADELLALEKYRYDESEDVTKKRNYRSGNMNRKMLHLVWAILEEVKENKPDELLALEKYRYDRSKDVTKKKRYYPSGNMNRKMLVLAWEIIRELKEHKGARMATCRDTVASGGDGT